MARHIDSVDLFGYGAGCSTTNEIICEWCGKTYEDKDDIVSKAFTDFAGKQVCECCYEKIENEVLHRMPDILKWYKLILKSKISDLSRQKSTLDEVERLLKKGE